MSKKATFAVLLLVALAIGLGVYDFYQKHEYKEITIHTGYTDEARKNDYYAARLFLKRMGIDTITKDSVQDLSGLPDTNTVLVITTQRSTLSPQRTDELIEWVKSGGHLIATSTRDWKYQGKYDEDEDEDSEDEEELDDRESPDPLQRYMGVRSGSRISLIDEDEEEDSIIDGLLPKLKTEKEGVYKIALKGASKPLSIENSWYNPLTVDDEHKAQTEEVNLYLGNFILRQNIGDGMVTLVSDLDFVTNEGIENYDHAEILWHLIHGLHKPLAQPKHVWLIHNDNMPSLWSIIWKNAWTFVLSLAILFFAWLLMSARRFGPMIPKQQEDRRSLMEHITSSGNFYWKNNKKQLLVNSSRDALTRRLAQVFPGWTQLSEKQQVKQLAEHVSMDTKAVHRLLFAPNIEQIDEFTQLIGDLERIRKEI